MFITCSVLREAGVVPEKLSCCSSCHEDAGHFHNMTELYSDEMYPEEDIHRGLGYDLIGDVCCVISQHLIDFYGPRRHAILKQLHDKKTETEYEPGD